jgi:hypothetical protein
MRTETTYIKYITLILVLLTAINTIVNSQGTDSRRTYAKKTKLYLGITVSPQKTNINNEKLPASSAMVYKKGTSFNFAIDGGYYFSKIAGISIGAGLTSYSTNLYLDSCSIKYQTTDDELEAYEMRIKGKSISEDQKISFLNVPVCFTLKFPAGKKSGFYLKGGMSFGIPVAKTFKGTGTFTYTGYYSAYPVLLQDLPDHGFPSNLNTPSSGNLKIKSLSPCLVASGGVTYYVNESIQLILGFNFNKSLGNISGYKPDSDFKLSSKANELNSLMAGSSNANTTASGLSIGLKYYLR